MAYHHRNGVTIHVTPCNARSRIKVRAPGLDTFYFFSDSVADAHRRLSTEAKALEDEGYTAAGQNLRILSNHVFPTPHDP